MSLEIDADEPLRIARPLILYLRHDGELTLWTERFVFSVQTMLLELLIELAGGTTFRALTDGADIASEPKLLDVLQRLLAAEVVARGDAQGAPSTERVVCLPIAPPAEDSIPANEKLRLATSSFIMLTQERQLLLWLAKEASFRELDPSALTWLRELGRPSTIEEVERRTDTALYGEDRALLAELVRTGLLLRSSAPASEPPPATREDAPARQRIETLVDEGSWIEDGRGALGTLTGTARIDGRPVVIVAYTEWRGRLTATEAPIGKVLRAQEMALRLRCPIVYLFDTGGPSESSASIDSFLGDESWGRVYKNQVTLSGRVPQIGVLFGSCSMPTSFPPALCDVVIFVDKKSFLSIAPPKSVKRWLGADVDAEKLGGAQMHCSVSGLGDILARSEDEALGSVRDLLAHLGEKRAAALSPAASRALGDIIPDKADKPFDVHEAIEAIVDRDSIVELKRDYAKEIVTAFARIEGRSVGIVANNSRHRGGIMFPESCEKETRFVSLCDAYGIPLLFLMDSPGYMIGADVERNGLLRATARLYTALVEARVPKITVVVRKAHTGGVYAMCGPCFDPDYFLALPTARIAILGAKASYEWLSGAERALPPGLREALQDHIEVRSKRDMDPRPLARQMAVDALVEFSDLRAELAGRFTQLASAPPRPRERHSVTQM